MRALTLHGPRQASIGDVLEPLPTNGEVLVRIRACGVCGSDLNAWRGVLGVEYPLPAGAPGHEALGEVVAVGPGVGDIRPGQTVTGLLWNGFADFGLALADNLVVVPDGLERGGILGEPLACAMNVVRRSAICSGDRIAIVGFGYLAALIVQLLPIGVSGWVAVSRRDDSRALARRLGADAAYDFGSIPSPLWDSFPVVIEAAGVQPTLDCATWLTAYVADWSSPDTTRMDHAVSTCKAGI
jgi:threonine dehydrogenase-like Zn-dependent dehydrogenase